jgi:hypothetical protein
MTRVLSIKTTKLYTTPVLLSSLLVIMILGAYIFAAHPIEIGRLAGRNLE